MDAEITVAQAIGLRRVAAELTQEFDAWMLAGYAPPPEREEFAGEYLAGCVLAAPILRAFAAELVLKAIRIKTIGTHKPGHNLRELFDALDKSTRSRIEQRGKSILRHSWPTVRSILVCHKNDFEDWRYLGEKWHPDMNPRGDDMDAALRTLIAAYEET